MQLEHCTSDAAVQAVAEAATRPGGGPPVITGTIGTLITAWRVEAVARLIDQAAEVGWAPDLCEADGHGLVVLTAEGGVYRFDTDRPRAAGDPDGPALRLITGGRTAAPDQEAATA
jgi:hypothetical protein